MLDNSKQPIETAPIEPADTSLWDHYRNVIRSSKGGWIAGHGVINHGYEMMEDFVGKVSYMQVVILNATGKLPERALADWIEAIHICLSWPDPRIWCNQMGALGGTVRASAVASTVVGIMASDSRAYGIKPIVEGMKFIQQALLDYQSGFTEVDIVSQNKTLGGKPAIMGYARPIAKGDERLAAMTTYTKKLQFETGQHLHLAWEIDRYLQNQYDESMNINGYVSAFLSDQGLTPDEAYRIFTFVLASGVTACFIDSRDKPAECFMPLHCEDIEYKGAKARPVPD